MMFFWIILVVAVVWLAKNWDKIMELKNLYKIRAFSKRVEEYYRDYKEDHA